VKWIRICYLDTSALIKLVIDEPETGILDDFLAREIGTQFNTTWLCVAEALGVLKRQWLQELKLCQTPYEKTSATRKYVVTANELRGYIGQKVLAISQVSMADDLIFAEIEALVERYGIDIADALQLVAIPRNFFYQFPVVPIVFITADQRLADAARTLAVEVWNERPVTVWDCNREPPPTLTPPGRPDRARPSA
jgi:predicted nucleic acid-binding protein